MRSFDYTPEELACKKDILVELRKLHHAGSEFWNSFSTEAFFATVGAGWSPAGNVRHLNKAIEPLNKALRLPAWLLRAMFGKARKPSRSFVDLRDTYLATLSRGAGAGSFAPEPFAPLSHSQEEREKLMTAREKLTHKLLSAIEKWSENDLDNYRLPHPLLGKLTVREMLFFTVYHSAHHPRSVASRLAICPSSNSGSSTRRGALSSASHRVVK